METIKAVELLEPTVLSDRAGIASDESEYSLNIAGVYQDSMTRDWAMETCHRVTQLAAEERVQNTWHDVNSLSEPGTFTDAVRAALVADVIVVSVYAADELPVALCAWIEAWLPGRLSRAGALAALIDVADTLDSQSVRTIEYLQAVARKGQLDFIPQERKRPVSSLLSIQPIAEPAAATQAPKEL